MLVVDEQHPDRTVVRHRRRRSRGRRPAAAAGPGAHPEAAAGARPDLQLAAVGGDPLAHPDQAEPAGVRRGGPPRPSSVTSTSTSLRQVADPHVDARSRAACLSVLVSASWTTR